MVSASRAAVALTANDKAAGAATPTANAEPFESVRSYADAPQADCTAKFSVPDALQEAMERHITFMGPMGSGYVLATLDVPLSVPELTAGGESMGYWHGRIGPFFVRPDSPDSHRLSEFAVYGLSASEETQTTADAVRDVLARGEKVTGSITLSWEVVPLEGENGRRFTLLDVAVWLAVTDAMNEDKSDQAESLILSAFRGAQEQHIGPNLEITATKIRSVTFTTDLVNRKVWDPLVLKPDGDGTATVGVDLANRTDRKLGITRRLSFHIDFADFADVGSTLARMGFNLWGQRVYEALSSLYAEGRTVVTTGEIAYAMGEKGKPGAALKRKINATISVLNVAHIFVDNEEEATAYKGYPHFRYDGSLLPMERLTGYVNGQFSDSLVHVLRFPPLSEFSAQRRQLTTCPVSVLQTPLSKTDRNLRVENYMRWQIAWMKNSSSKRGRKITLKDLFRSVKATSSTDRKRTREKAERLLSYYSSKECHWIEGWESMTDGFLITC